jgi:hypothetical protein
MCTYLEGDEHLDKLSDAELNQLWAEVRQRTGEDWRVAELVRVRRRWFRQPRVAKAYELFHHIAGSEFQIINFYRPDRRGNSINPVNEAAFIAAYFYGLLAGLRKEVP